MTEVRESARPAPPHQLSPHEADDSRVPDLLRRMTLAEKLAQIVGFWEKADGRPSHRSRASSVRSRASGTSRGTGSGTSPGRTGPARSIPPPGRRGCGRSSATS